MRILLLSVVFLPRLFLLAVQGEVLSLKPARENCTNVQLLLLSAEVSLPFVVAKGLGIGVSFLPAKKYCSIVF